MPPIEYVQMAEQVKGKKLKHLVLPHPRFQWEGLTPAQVDAQLIVMHRLVRPEPGEVPLRPGDEMGGGVVSEADDSEAE